MPPTTYRGRHIHVDLPLSLRLYPTVYVTHTSKSTRAVKLSVNMCLHVNLCNGCFDAPKFSHTWGSKVISVWSVNMRGHLCPIENVLSFFPLKKRCNFECANTLWHCWYLSSFLYCRFQLKAAWSIWRNIQRPCWQCSSRLQWYNLRIWSNWHG